MDTKSLEELSPGEVLTYIQNLFRAWGIFNQKLVVSHEGVDYACLCQDTAFVVYRLLPPHGAPPGRPGWPVCLVTPTEVIDECSPPYDGEDFFACHLGLADWLALLEAYYGQP